MLRGLKLVYASIPVRKLRELFPFPRLFPFNSFLKRLIEKNRHSLSWYVLSKLGLSGSSVVRIDSGGQALLSLNRGSPLGNKNDEIVVPVDKVIYKWILRRGLWEIKEVNFLRKYISDSRNRNIVFLDFGGHAGLVTRQLLRTVSNQISLAYIVEPHSRYIEAIEHNCSEWIIDRKLIVIPFALSNVTARTSLYIENSNFGNASLLKVSNVDSTKSHQHPVHTITVGDFENIIFHKDVKYVLKCDIQGMDALVLSKFSHSFWNQVECAVIEVWALNSISEQDVKKLISLWGNFSFFSWDSEWKIKVSLEEIQKFWLSKSGATRNLYISV
jgi:FkbM family methyltransferase